MLSNLSQSKKIPRLFLVQGVPTLGSQLPPMKGVRLLWPDYLNRFESAVLDLSLSGIVVPSTQLLSKVKLGQSFDVKLKLEWDEGGPANSVPLKARVVRMTGNVIGLVFESISIEGRLVLDQVAKDNLVQNHLNELSTEELSPHLRSDIWIHGPFDTNFFIWFKEDGNLKQAVIEYDHLLWIYQDGKVSLERSVSASDEARGYLAPEALSGAAPGRHSGRVSMGASWLDRLLKLMELTANPQFLPLIQVLKHQRSQ